MPNKAKTAIEKQEQTSRKKQALRVWLGLLTSSQLIEKQVRARFRTEFDTTLPRFDVMAALGEQLRKAKVCLAKRTIDDNSSRTFSLGTGW